MERCGELTRCVLLIGKNLADSAWVENVECTMPANRNSSTLGEDEDLGVLDSDAAACDEFNDERFEGPPTS